MVVRARAAKELRQRLVPGAIADRLRSPPVANRRVRPEVGHGLLPEQEHERPAARCADRAKPVSGDREGVLAVAIQA
jgi:hypothetical protein